MDIITNSVDVYLNKLWEIVKEPGMLQSMGCKKLDRIWQLNDSSPLCRQ